MPASPARSTKTAKQQPAKGRRLMKLPTLIMVCAVTWGAINFWNQIGKLNDRHQQVSALEHKLDEVRQMNDETKREVARLNDNEYIEQILRKNYGFVKPGETLFYRPKTTK
ncbi:FtsB family cell division protein [Paenibacillus hamazuiensis]|uniref:FtsB family cell division protein n=1 Tax=Paenibacillus hamazuiensis TaxID=2936508 RepID=UPI00200BE6B4|nr:septum formation initiator family protein [Paenibacillus hamazuiensis]